MVDQHRGTQAYPLQRNSGGLFQFQNFLGGLGKVFVEIPLLLLPKPASILFLPLVLIPRMLPIKPPCTLISPQVGSQGIQPATGTIIMM